MKITEQDREWLRGVLAMLKEGGVWYVPRARTSYRCSHARKTMYRDGPGDAASELVAKDIGWAVESWGLDKRRAE